MTNKPEASKLERIQLHMFKDGVSTKRIIEVDPGIDTVQHEGVAYSRTKDVAGLHGHPGASKHPMVAVFKP